MKLTKNNIGKTYFDPSLKGKEVIVNFSEYSWMRNKPESTLTGNVEIQSCGGDIEEMYEVKDYGYGQDAYIWSWILIIKAEGK